MNSICFPPVSSPTLWSISLRTLTLATDSPRSTSDEVFDSDTTRIRGDRDIVENVAILLMWTQPNINDPNFLDALNRLRSADRRFSASIIWV